MQHKLSIKTFLWILGENVSWYLVSKAAPGEKKSNRCSIYWWAGNSDDSQYVLLIWCICKRALRLEFRNLKELINIRKNVKPLFLKVHLRDAVKYGMKNAKKNQAQLQRTKLRDVVQMTEIYYGPKLNTNVTK